MSLSVNASSSLPVGRVGTWGDTYTGMLFSCVSHGSSFSVSPPSLLALPSLCPTPPGPSLSPGLSLVGVCFPVCVEVPSETEAVQGNPMKLRCISCMKREEVEATTVVEWFYRPEGGKDFLVCLTADSGLCWPLPFCTWLPTVWGNDDLTNTGSFSPKRDSSSADN